tara:strand:- start:267 stop:455 length:189 start_codon:yes stop_codon:yes gene_type:complete
MDEKQKMIIRQSSVKSSIDYWKIKTETNEQDITINDIIDTASEIAYYCYHGKKYNKNNKLLK